MAAHAARLVPPPRDELVIKVLVALQIPGVDVGEILQAHRRHTIEEMQRYTQLKATAARGRPARSRSSPTPSSSGSRRSSAGSTPPTSA